MVDIYRGQKGECEPVRAEGQVTRRYEQLDKIIVDLENISQKLRSRLECFLTPSAPTVGEEKALNNVVQSPLAADMEVKLIKLNGIAIGLSDILKRLDF